MDTDPSSPSRERILVAATELFARHGYEATSTRAIGEAADLNIATVAYHVGGKAELYLDVMRRSHAAQRDAVIEALGQLTDCEPTPDATRRALNGFADAYLSFCLRHPEVPALWMRRWLAEGEDVRAIEAEFAGPLVARVTSEVRGALDRAGLTHGVDIEMLTYSIVWMTHAFSRAGLVDATGTRQDSASLAMTDRFRAHVHRMIDSAIAP